MSIEKQLNRLECGVLGPKVGPDPYRKGAIFGPLESIEGSLLHSMQLKGSFILHQRSTAGADCNATT